MEEQRRTQNTCRYCCHYAAYYTKKDLHFERTGQGYCDRRREEVGDGFRCDRMMKDSDRTSYRKLCAKRELYEILKSLSAIRQIFEENSREEESDE